MAAATVPERVAWAVDLLDVRPDEHVLEVGCGPGVAVSLVCARLEERGRVTALDRSATAVARTRGRNAACLADGRLVVVHGDLAGLDAAPDTFDKAFAVNVNVFWTRDADVECAVLARVVRPGGVVRLVFGGPAPGRARGVAPGIAAKLARHGFHTDVTAGPTGTLLCVTGTRGP